MSPLGKLVITVIDNNHTAQYASIGDRSTPFGLKICAVRKCVRMPSLKYIIMYTNQA